MFLFVHIEIPLVVPVEFSIKMQLDSISLSTRFITSFPNEIC